VSGSTPTGTELSANLAYPFTVLAGTSNNVGITLQGIPADVSIVPSSNEDVQGDESGGFDLYGFYKADGTTIYPRQFNVFALDADGNVIVGPGAPAVTLTSSATSTLSNGVPAAGNPNLLTVTPVTYTASAALQMTATATPSTVDGSNSGASPVTRTVAVRIPYVNAPRVYVVDLLDNEVGAVNIADEWGNPVAHTGLFPDLDGASGAAFDPILNRLYVVNQYGSTVTAYDLDGNELTLTGNSDEPFPNLDQPLAITFDQSKQRLIVTNTGSAPTVYDEAGNQLTVSGTWMEKEASPVCLAYGVLADPNNNLVYVTDADQGAPACGAGGAGKVEAYDTNGNAQFSWEAGDGVAGLAQDPVSHWLYVSDDSLSINAYDEQGHLIPGILAQDNSGTAFPNANGAFGLAFSPGNRYLYVANYSGDTVTVYDRQGNQINTSGSLFQANQTNGPVGIVVVP